MLPEFLLAETTIREAGTGPVVGLGANRGGVLILTLGITRIIEQESLDVAILGSADGADWSGKPLIVFPQKFYCGTYQLILDLTDRPDVQHIRVKWHVNRWGKGDPTPLFDMYVFVKALLPEAIAMGA